MQPERQVLKLSELFATEDADPSLELKVVVFNINPGYNEKLKKNCKTLLEYMEFVEKIRKNTENYELDDAVEKAVTGLAKGQAEERVKIANTMRQKGFSTKQIADIMEISTEEVEKLFVK